MGSFLLELGWEAGTWEYVESSIKSAGDQKIRPLGQVWRSQVLGNAGQGEG